MSEALLSASWYRVAEIKPQRSSQARLHRHSLPLWSGTPAGVGRIGLSLWQLFKQVKNIDQVGLERRASSMR